MGDKPVQGRTIGLAALAGGLGSVLSLLLAAIAGSPYLSADHVNGWIVVFAAAYLLLFVSLPFAMELRMRERVDDRDDRWERSVLIWGGIAAAVLVLALLLGSASGFSGSSLAGATGLITAIESGLVVLAVGAWLVSN